MSICPPPYRNNMIDLEWVWPTALVEGSVHFFEAFFSGFVFWKKLLSYGLRSDILYY